MADYDVFYWRSFSSLMSPVSALSLLRGSHAYLFTIEADSLEDAFYKMQGEKWSPRGEGRATIRELGLTHTSMSVGDVLVDEKENIWVVQDIGFKRIGGLEG